jgi:hypothetical protein
MCIAHRRTWLLILGLGARGIAPLGAQGTPIRIGMEYVLIDNGARVRQVAREMAATGATGAKHYAEHAEWDAMQKSATGPIDFSRLDAFVREFQSAGFRDLVICLRSRSRWASRKFALIGAQDIAPKPEFLAAYARWIGAIVERYDGDGQGDMPGLRAPVRWYEIGSEFSTYEAEPVDEYLEMLGAAYRAAHAAFPAVTIAHAAFLTTNTFASAHQPGQYEAAFAAVDKRIMHHGLADMRRVLDRGDIFDAVNIHSLGNPAEIEEIVAWLNWEMQQRRWRKPILLSDTAAEPFLAWGDATTCTGPRNQLAVAVAPATEADRCRLASYFTRLIDGNPPTLAWTHRYVAADLVKRVVIAADQGIVLINTAFVEDLAWLKLKAFHAGTGPSAWSGMIDLARHERRPAFTALARVAGWLSNYQSIRRVKLADPAVRLYELRRDGVTSWIAWVDPQRVWLPGEVEPSRDLTIPGVGGDLVAQAAIDGESTLPPVGGRVHLTTMPLWIGRR